jgi:hypothetical protein
MPAVFFWIKSGKNIKTSKKNWYGNGFFPAKTLTFVPEKDEYRWHHLHDTQNLLNTAYANVF